MTYYLKPLITRHQATLNMNDHLFSSWWKKLQNTVELISIEKIYLPFWCYNYKATAHSIPEGMTGRVAIEPLSEMNAILPVDYAIYSTDEELYPIKKQIDKKIAERLLYWELFSKEKRREKIQVEVLDQWLVYVPYWIGYTKDRNGQYDLIAVDGLNGKIDIPMKDTVVAYISKVDKEENDEKAVQ